LGIEEELIDITAQNIVKQYGMWYFSKDTVLEMLSVKHREWIKKPFINGNRELITK
jgi:hypothetical protein